MKHYFLFLVVLTTFSCGYADEIDDYLAFTDSHAEVLGPWGDASCGEIEILRDRASIEAAMQKTGRKIGVIVRDRFWIWLNDPVRFPSGALGVYGRMMWIKQLEGVAGVAILPQFADGSIALILTYRHATRSWEWELPRGAVEPGENALEAASRELAEETGYVAAKINFLGSMPPDTGMMSTVASVFVAHIERCGTHAPEESEAILKCQRFSRDEIQEGLSKGYITTIIKGKPVSVALRDPFLTFALAKSHCHTN